MGRDSGMELQELSPDGYPPVRGSAYRKAAGGGPARPRSQPTSYLDLMLAKVAKCVQRATAAAAAQAAAQAEAERISQELRALGHGDQVPALPWLPPPPGGA